VHVVFGHFPDYALALQVAGGAYLLYVAIRLAIQRRRVGRPRAVGVLVCRVSPGFLTNITNPKVRCFLADIRHSFPRRRPILQASGGGHVALNALCWHTLLATCSRASAFGRLRARASLANRIARSPWAWD